MLSSIFTTSIALISAIPAFVSALPAGLESRNDHWAPQHSAGQLGLACDLSQAKLEFPFHPKNLTGQSFPSSQIGFAFGVQNYTCEASGTYKSAGAVAKLFDVSCLFVKDQEGFKTLPDIGIKAWKSAPHEITTDKIHSAPSLFTSAHFLGDHYFPPDGKGGIIPKWDFTPVGAVFAGKKEATFSGKLKATEAAPTGKQDINWLQLESADSYGKLADEVYRTDTREGQPPQSCTPGSDPISVKYVSNYWFMGGSVKSSQHY